MRCQMVISAMEGNTGSAYYGTKIQGVQKHLTMKMTLEQISEGSIGSSHMKSGKLFQA